MEYPCGVIRDLLPVCIDTDCSLETAAAVNRHLQHCGQCRRLYRQWKLEHDRIDYEITQVETWGTLWVLKALFDWLRWNWRRVLKGIILLLCACMILAMLLCLWWGLIRAFCVPASTPNHLIWFESPL